MDHFRTNDIIFVVNYNLFMCIRHKYHTIHVCQQATFVLVMDTSGTAVHIVSHKLP